MNSFREYYGQDIDGNRGEVRHIHELEESDNEKIKEQLLGLKGQVGYDETTTIDLCSDLTGDNVEFDIKVSDYLSVEEYLNSSYTDLSPEFILDDIKFRIGQIDDTYYILQGAEITSELYAPLEGIDLLQQIKKDIRI